MNGVRQLDPEYISKVNPQQVEQWVKAGAVKRQGDSYYVVEGSSMSFGESCFVKINDTDPKPESKAYQLNGKGLVVEKTAVQSEPKGEVVKTEKESVIPMERLVTDVLGFGSDSADAADFINFIKDPKNKFDLKFDEDGNINFGDMPKDKQSEILQSAIDQYAEKHPEKFTTTQKNEVIFTENSDAEAIQKLENDGAIESKTDAESSGAYTVRDKQKLEKAVPKKINVSYEKTDPAQGNVDAAVTTTTTRKSNTLEIPEGVKLRDDKDARKQLEANAREVYSNMVADANEDDLQMRDAIDLYIAERKYNDKIEKRMAELRKFTSTVGGEKEKEGILNDAGIVQLYIDKYANQDDKNKLNGLVDAIKNTENPDDQQKILNALKSANIIGIGDKFSDLNDDLKREGSLIALSKELGYEPQTLLRLMATSDVMSERSSEQKLKDDQYFIKEQSKDFVRNQQAKQDIEDTTVHFSKNARKNAPDDGRIHTDIGDKGRLLVKSCPEMFCDEIKAEAFKGHEGDEDNGYFTREIDGKTRYFQFNDKKWKALMGALCDPTTVTDEQMNLLFGDDQPAKDNFIKDLNMTLQEGRNGLLVRVPSVDAPSGQGSVTLEYIIGKEDGKVGNRELNNLRGMVESAGYSVDKNTTGGKRLLHVLKNAGIGYGIGFATGGLGSLLGGALDFAGQTASQVVTLTGQDTLTGQTTLTGKDTLSGDVTLDYHDSVTTTDYYTDQFGTTSITHNTPVSGTTTGNVSLTGDVSVTGDVSLTGDVSVTDRIDGQNYSGSVPNNHVGQANRTGLLGALAAGVNSLFTMGKVEERGRNTDDIFNPIKYSLETNTDNESLSLKRPQYNKIETRQGSTEIHIKVPTLNAKRFQGPAAYSILYQYEDGTEVKPRDFARAYQTKINGSMSNRYFYVYPELEVNGKKIIPVDDYETKYNLIPEGRDGGSTGVDLPEQSYTKKTNLWAILE